MRRRRSIDPSMGSIDRSTARSMSTSMGSIDRSIDRSIDTLKREYIPCSDIRRVLVVYRRVSSHARTHMGASIARVRARAHERSRATQTQTHTQGVVVVVDRAVAMDVFVVGWTPTGRTDGHAMGPSKWTTPRALKAAWTAFRGSVRARVIDCVID